MRTRQGFMWVWAVITVFVATVLPLPGLISAGDLEPSDPPGPTMKTLSEVEPRTPISSVPFTIDQPGSYYLTGELTSTGDGIIVNVDNVSIDLKGFSLIGPGSGSTYGIYMNGLSNVEIQNGTVQNFHGSGIYEGNSDGSDHRVIGVRAISNSEYNIRLDGAGHVVKNCTVARGWKGIYVGEGCTVTGNICYGAGTYGRGIFVGSFSTVTGNTCFDNHSHGISTSGGGCTITGNTVWNNGDHGIGVYDGCTVIGNTVRYNNQHGSGDKGGIRVRNDCLVKDNTVTGSKQKNIFVIGSGNTIEENLVTDSANGIYFNSTGNFYSNNRASGNGTDYANTAGNTDGGGNASF